MAIIGTGVLDSPKQQEPVNIEAEIAKFESNGIRERIFISYVARAFMNFALKQAGTIDEILSTNSAP